MVNVSNQQNGTSFQWFSSSECIALLAVLMTESVAIVTLNIVTLIVFIKSDNLRKRSMYLVINLAVADMFVGGYSEITSFVDLGKLCSFWQRTQGSSYSYFLQLFFIAASLTNLAAISLERAHATFRPFRHRIIKKWVFVFIITINWVTSWLVSAASYLLRKSMCLIYVFCSFIAFCLFVVCASYASIVVKLYCGAHPQHHGAASRERKLTKTLFIVTVVSLLMWLPSAILYLLSATSRLVFLLPGRVILRFDYILMILYYANSLMNPIAYAIRMPDFKTALVSLFRRQQRQVEIIPLGPL